MSICPCGSGHRRRLASARYTSLARGCEAAAREEGWEGAEDWEQAEGWEGAEGWTETLWREVPPCAFQRTEGQKAAEGRAGWTAAGLNQMGAWTEADRKQAVAWVLAWRQVGWKEPEWRDADWGLVDRREKAC